MAGSSFSPASVTVPALAYLGDAVLEVLVRDRLVRQGLCHSGGLNSAALDYVRATAQSAAVDRLLPVLTEEELGVYRRGKNAGHTKNVPKSATPEEYHRATGLECLFAWLHLTGDNARMRELFDIAYPVSPEL